MQTRIVPQWGYKRSAAINLLGDTLAADGQGVQTRCEPLERFVVGRSEFLRVAAVDGTQLRCVGPGWDTYNWLGAWVLPVSGVTPTTIVAVGDDEVTLQATLSGLAVGDLVRFEAEQ
jgi:hypothetical protein